MHCEINQVTIVVFGKDKTGYPHRISASVNPKALKVEENQEHGSSSAIASSTFHGGSFQMAKMTLMMAEAYMSWIRPLVLINNIDVETPRATQ